MESDLIKRHKIIEFIDSLQLEERCILQAWLFHFWEVTYKSRQQMLKAKAAELTESDLDITRPFMCWRIYVSRSRLENCQRACDIIDLEASEEANRITDLEKQCELRQHELEKRLEE